MLSTQSVSKQFSSRVLKEISFERQPGSVTLLLGANGSGKTTLLKILAHLSTPTSGKVTLFGKEVTPQDVSYVGHQHMLYDELSPRENLELYLSLRGVSYDLDVAFDEWNLREKDTRVKELSEGSKVKVSLIRAFCIETPLLFLDEPSSSLDSVATEIVQRKIQERREAKTITVLSSHDLERLSLVATSALLLHQGGIAIDSYIQEGSVKEVVEQYHRYNR